MAQKLDLFLPVKPWIVTQTFGQNNVPLYKELGLKGHTGIDILTNHGQPVYASHDGIVVVAGVADSKEGVGVVIKTKEPFEYKEGQSFFKTIYWHLVNNVPVKPGQEVKTGQLIGYADNTGASTGDHLHWGLKPIYQGEQDWQIWNAEQDNGFKGNIDPLIYVNNYFAQDADLVRSIYLRIIELLKQFLRM